MTLELVSLEGAAMARSREESQRVDSFAISGALLLLLSLAYLFIPREALDNKSPLMVLVSPNKTVREIGLNYGCEGGGFSWTIETCIQNGGKWIRKQVPESAFDRFLTTDGKDASDVAAQIREDLPTTGGLFLLIGASPAIGFLVFQRIRGSRK